MDLVLPSPDMHDDWKSFARALNAALQEQAADLASTTNTLQHNVTHIEPGSLPQPPAGYNRIWLSTADARLFLENPLYDPPTAPDIVYIDTAAIADAAITAQQLANDSVGTGALLDSAVTSLELAANAVTNVKVADNAIGSLEIIDLAVISAKVGAAAILTAKIGDAQVLTAKIGDAQIINAKIADATILGAKLVDATIIGAKIANGTIVTALIGDAQIVEAKIADLAVNTAKIANAAITSAKIANLAVGAANIIAASIQTAHIADLNVTGAKIADLSVDSAKIANVLQSSNWNAATKVGWQIDKAGVLRGRGIEIYDNSGNLLFGSGSTIRTLGYQGDLNATAADYLNTNPKFADWPTGQTMPTGWSTFNPGGGTFTKVAGLGTQNAMRLDGIAGFFFTVWQQFGSNTVQTVAPGQTVQLFAAIRLIAGSLAGMGVHMEFYGSDNVHKGNASITFSTDPDSTGTVVGAGAVDNEYSWSKTVKAPAGSYYFYFFIDHASTVHGSIAGSRAATWRLAGVRTATDMDLKTYNQEAFATLGATIGTNLYGQMTSGNISTFIASAAIGTALIANAAIGSALIADAAVIEAKIGALSVVTAKIGDTAVTTAKIFDAAITTAKIGDAQISTAKIQDLAVNTAKIGDLQVTTLKIGNNAVTLPVSAYTAGYVTITNINTWTDVQSVSITTTGAMVHIFMQLYIGPDDAGSFTTATCPQYRLLRGAGVVFGPIDVTHTTTAGNNGAGMNNGQFVEQPAAGTYTYTLQVQKRDGDATQVAHRSLLVMEVKK